MTTERIADCGTVEEKKDMLVKDIKNVVGDTDVLLRGIAGAATDGYAAARGRIDGKLDELRTGIGAARSRVARRARGYADSGRAYARANPWQLIGAMAVVGIAVGYLLRRR
jgi:ElaB/YqjD/DUF883 family membrane-anchored ribosome-binding protein